MKILKDRFDRSSQRWGIRFPAQDLLARRRGRIIQKGWIIWYLFGRNERGEYMDIWIGHRMSNDSHRRIYFDGTSEPLPSPQPFYLISKDPEKTARNRAEFFARNREVSALRKEKGFLLPGEEEEAAPEET